MDDVKEVFEAAKNHNLGAVKYFIETGVVPANVVDNEEKTLAHVTAVNDELPIFQFVVEKDPSILRKYGAEQDKNLSLIKLAVKHNSFSIVQYLIEKWYAETFSSKDGSDPVLGYDIALIWAARSGHLKVFKYLVEKRNVDVSGPSSSDRAAKLFVNAVESCNRDVIEYLIQEKNLNVSSPLIQENKNFSLLTVVRKCDINFLKFILDEIKVNWDINQQDEGTGHTLVHEVLLADRIDIFKYLIDQKHADLNKASKDTKETPIYYTVRGSELMCEYLVEHGANVNWQNYEGNSPLHCASSDEMCMYLVKQNADINQTNNDGDTPLHCALRADCENWPRYRSCKYLMQYGADVNRANNKGETPLHLAVENEQSPNSFRLCKLLTEYGADINRRNSANGETPVYKAALRNKLKILEYLVGEQQADVGLADENGRTPLHGAAWKGREGVCKYLVEHGANINARDNHGWTPLHVAASNEHYEVCKYLIKQGADTSAKNNAGKSPKEETSDSRIIQCMESASANEKRSRRNVPLSSSPETLFWRNGESFQNRREKIAAKFGENWEGFEESPLSVFSSRINEPHFQNFLTLIIVGLLSRNRKTSGHSTRVSPSSEAISRDRIDPIAEVAANYYLPHFEDR